MKVGFIGLGTMGSHMAMNLRKAGHDLLVNDIRPSAGKSLVEAGAIWAESVGMLARSSDIVFTSLPGPKEIKEIALGEGGLLGNMRTGSAWFDLSTNSPTVVKELHQRFEQKGVAFLDAPVSGGPHGAAVRKLALWIGGAKEQFDRHKVVLDAIGDQVTYIGPIGAGLVAKLVHNLAGSAVQTALAEAFTLGVKAGVEPLALWHAIRQGAYGRARTFDRMAEQFLPGTYDPASFMLRLAEKDVALATELARELNVPLRLGTLVHEEMTEALRRGWGDRDARVSMLLQQERAGLNISVPKEELKKILDAG